MNLQQELQKNKNDITTFLTTYLSDSSSTFENVPFNTDLKTKLLKYTTNGKMIRGSLAIISAKLFWNITHIDLIKIASAIELFQSAFLIQDDIMDEDVIRRGMPAIHIQYGPKRYGESMAMCLSDLAIFLGFDLLSQIKNAPHITSRASREIMFTAFGQMNDIDLEQSKNLTKERILQMYEHKTSHYTFTLPLMLSAIYCDSSIDFEPLGKQMGLLFQIKDDLIGLLGDPNITGKPNNSDIKEKKSTLYRALLLSSATSEDKTKIEQIYSQKTISDTDVEQIKSFLVSYTIPEKCFEYIETYKKTCFALIDSYDVTDTGKQFLKELVTYLYEREK